MNMNGFQPPRSFEDIKALFEQFEVFLPEENRKIIREILAEIEAKGKNVDKEHIEQLITNLISKLGMNFK
ncbi:MAG: hypothetical protein PWQ67_860 [Clostridia bacterium]|jgi:TRAP-type C4-dicarboxylate transport system substrate-binding protein|nr:hypothetical protein [Clostridia bacterium]MDN5322406.1 hypothetical protein [Clostridia bacterium]